MIYLKLILVFCKIGLFAFGGGYAILPMIEQDIQTFGLIPQQEFADIVALSNMTPGPIAINAATFVGFRTAGFWGAVAATVGVSLPCFLLVLSVAAFINKFKDSAAVKDIMSGIRPTTVGLISSAVLTFLGMSVFREGFLSAAMLQNPLQFISLPSLLIFALTLFASVKFKAHPILLTVLAGVLGAFIM